MRVVRLSLFLILLCSVSILILLGQIGLGSLTGTVEDQNGVTIPGATITLIHEETGRMHTTLTDDTGSYRFRGIRFGGYELRVEISGFKTHRQRVVILQYADDLRVDVTFDTGDPEEVVVVDPDPGPSPPEKRERMKPTWNVWVEEFQDKKPIFGPIEDPLKTNRPYQVVLDLAAFVYDPGSKSVFGRAAGAQLSEWFAKSQRDHDYLQILMIPDDAYLEMASPWNKSMKIDLKKMRRALKRQRRKYRRPIWQRLKRKPCQDPEKLTNKCPDFVFGRTVFSFRTKDKEGLTSIAVSVWVNEKPIDEFSLPLCISTSGSWIQCDTANRVEHSFQGVQILAASEDKSDSIPDAALHFVSLGGRKTVGVFRRKDWDKGEYKTWTLPSPDTLQKESSLIVDHFGSAAAAAEARMQNGRALFNTFFPSKNLSYPEGVSHFLEFVASNSNGGRNAPSIFVRILDPDVSFQVPLGMMAVPVNGEDRFLGFDFKISAPLKHQDYRQESDCIEKWVMAVPDPATGELESARQFFFETWFAFCSGRDDCKKTMKEFEHWLWSLVQEKKPLALMVLAHHDEQSLYFNLNSKVSPANVRRNFLRPSIVILNACGTAGPGAQGFVNKFSEKGINTIIATTTKVPHNLAGKFFKTLADALPQNAEESQSTISDAFLEALQRLRREYGSKVLIYSLLGDGNLRLCPPPEG